MLLEYYRDIPDNQVTVNINLLVIRALIELDKPYKAYQLLQEITRFKQEYINQYYVLSFLIKKKLGHIMTEDVNNIFDTWHMNERFA